MRLFVAAGFVALAGTSGACATLDGLADYQQCAGACADMRGGAGDDASLAAWSVDSGGSVESGDASVGEATPRRYEADSAMDAGFIGAPPPGDAGESVDGDGRDAPFDAGVDSDAEAGQAPMPGATCGPMATAARCAAGQICCASLTSQTNACAATCAANASLACATASDCPSSTPICCAQAAFAIDSAGDLPPKCAVVAFSASCSSTCNDAPPTSCTFFGAMRLCRHDADCQSDSNNPLAGGQCWNFNKAPESWCTNATVGTAGGAAHQP